VRPVVAFCWISLQTHDDLWASSWVLGKSQRSHGARSGEYRGWGNGGIWFLNKKCCTVWEVWQGTLTRCGIWLFLHFPAFSTKWNPSYASDLRCKKLEFTVRRTGTNAYFTTPKLSVKVSSMTICCDFVTVAFYFGWCVVLPSQELMLHLRIAVEGQKFVPSINLW